MGTRFPLLLLSPLVLVSCSQGPQSQDIVQQVQQVLTEASVSCSVKVAYNGVGEGDADNAYASLTFAIAEQAGQPKLVPVEVLLSRVNGDGWEVADISKKKIVETASSVCI